MVRASSNGSVVNEMVNEMVNYLVKSVQRALILASGEAVG